MKIKLVSLFMLRRSFVRLEQGLYSCCSSTDRYYKWLESMVLPGRLVDDKKGFVCRKYHVKEIRKEIYSAEQGKLDISRNYSYHLDKYLEECSTSMVDRDIYTRDYDIRLRILNSLPPETLKVMFKEWMDNGSPNMTLFDFKQLVPVSIRED